MTKPWILITGPTASGKTSLAIEVSRKLSGEIISADSRQVYRQMDIGTGKDLGEYVTGGTPVPYHLINICDPGEKYHVHAFQQDFAKSITAIESRKNIPVICGGTGLYLESILERHSFTAIPVDQDFRDRLSTLDKRDLASWYIKGNQLPFPVDLTSRKRMIRALEMQRYLEKESVPNTPLPDSACINFLLDISREERRKRISVRLQSRLKSGLIQEVEKLISLIGETDLLYYGLEYKYVTDHVMGRITFDELQVKLETEIHRYAKRQMTWFRRMEKRGTILHRIDGLLPLSEQVEEVVTQYNLVH